MQRERVNVINYWYGLYGGAITAFALHKLIQDLNYSCSLINNMRTREILIQRKNFNKDFSDKYLNRTPQITNNYSLENINDDVEIFITGSDQVFRTKYISEQIHQYLLTFTSSNKKRIAFSASFGVGKEQFLEETTEKDMKIMKEAMKSFDYISVREKSGVEICKNVFGVDAEWIIDPVFILNKQKYEVLAKDSNINYTKDIATYILRPNKDYEKAYNYLSKKYDCKISHLAGGQVLLEDWLNAIKNCRLLVTDSFHGVCFAIIFNKPFICIAQDVNGKARLDSIFELLGIDNQSISSVNEIYSKDCIFKVDYNLVNQRISEEANRGLEALKRALEMPVSKQNEKIATRITYLENRVQELERQANLCYQVKRYIWNKWLEVYHLYLPKSVKNMIKFFKNISKGSN